MISTSTKMTEAGLFVSKPALIHSYYSCGIKPRTAGLRPASSWSMSRLPALRGFVFMATSKLQRRVSELLSIHFGGFTIRENHRPDWLLGPDGERLELDFYIEEMGIAIEVQGEQHYAYVPHFHGEYANFERRQQLDATKRKVCLRRDIELFEVFDEASVLPVIEKLVTRLRMASAAVLENGQIGPITDADLPFVAALSRIYRASKVINVCIPGVQSTKPEKNRRAFAKIHSHGSVIGELVSAYGPDLRRIVGEVRYVCILDTLKFSQQCDMVYTSQIRDTRRTKLKAIRNQVGSSQFRTIKRGRKLKIKQVSLFEYRVWGGENEHVVVITDEGITCDCAGFVSGQTKRCSHIVRLLKFQGLSLHETVVSYKHETPVNVVIGVHRGVVIGD